MAYGKSGAFFSSNRYLVLLNQFSDVLEPHRSFIELYSVVLSQGIHHVGGGNRLPYPIFPAAGFDQIIEQNGNNVIGLDKGSIFIHDPKAVGVSVGCHSQPGSAGSHGCPHFVQKGAIGFGSVSTKENVTGIVDGNDLDAHLAQHVIRIRPSRSPEWVIDDLEPCLANRAQVNDLFQPGQIGWLRINLLRPDRVLAIRLSTIFRDDARGYAIDGNQRFNLASNFRQGRGSIRGGELDAVVFRWIMRGSEVDGPLRLQANHFVSNGWRWSGLRNHQGLDPGAA